VEYRAFAQRSSGRRPVQCVGHADQHVSGCPHIDQNRPGAKEALRRGRIRLTNKTADRPLHVVGKLSK